MEWKWCCFESLEMNEWMNDWLISKTWHSISTPNSILGPSSHSQLKAPKLGIQYRLPTPTPTVTRNNRIRTNRNFSIRAEYRYSITLVSFIYYNQYSFIHPNLISSHLIQSYCSDGDSGGGGDFFAGFLVGGAVFGTLAYIFAPQVIPLS